MVLAMTDRGKSVVEKLVPSGEVHLCPLDDYLNYQQTGNEPIPVFRRRLLSRLSNPDTRIEDAEREFVSDEALKRRILGRVAPLARFAKRILRCGR